VGSSVQVLGALAGFVTLPIVVHALGSARFGVLVVVVSLAPWLTVIDGALYPATRLLVGEARSGDRFTAPVGLLRSARRLAVKVACLNLSTLVLGLFVLPLVSLFGSGGIADRSELVVAILAFSIPIIASGPGGVYLGALEGVGRTVIAAIFVGIGPLFALPITLAVAYLGGGLTELCAVQGLAVALPRACAWGYWHLRPSADSERATTARLRIPLITQMVLLTAATLIQTGLDPVIVSSQLGAEEAGTFGVANRIINGALIPLVVLAPLFAANLAAARGRGWDRSRHHDLRRLVLQAGGVGLAVGLVITGAGPLAARVLGAGQVDAPWDLYAAGGLFVFATFLSTPLYHAFSGPRGLRRSVRLNAALVVVNVGLSLLLVRVTGPSGPLWASAIAGFGAATYWLLMWRRHPEWLSEVHATRGRDADREHPPSAG
jgi:O-antigen/teichoic acid export membrane protein